MLTVGMVTALAIMGGHVALVRTVWPGERAEPVGIAPDPALRLRAATLQSISDTMKRETEAMWAKLKLAKVQHSTLETEVAAVRAEVRELKAERAVLRREVKRLHKVTVLAAAEDEGEEDGSDSPPEGYDFDTKSVCKIF